MFIVKIIKSNTTYIVQEHLHTFSCSAYVILADFTSTFSVNSSTSLSTNFFLYLQLS